ncbi:hypothetical protein GQ53DRAFT_731201 [Thozetella sp. PMI_491]|nr:hypothetical protein GQ53DRAFT_731201 [Thozetella sp. PMI_491]
MQPPKSPKQSRRTARSRRLPYTTIACEQCKRRKAKCSGERPCKGCRGSDVVCVYDRETRFRTGGRSDAAGSVEHPLEAATSWLPASTAARRTSVPADPRPRFTAESSDYYLRLAQKRLVALSPETAATPQRSQPLALVGADVIRRLIHHRANSSPETCLDALDTETWLNVFQNYEEEVGLQYPFVDLERLRRLVRQSSGESAGGEVTGAGPSADDDAPAERCREIAILILVVTSTFTEPALFGISNPLVEEIHAGAILRAHLGNINTDELVLLILIAIYFFLCDKETLAWRIIGTVHRLLQELICQNSGESQPSSSVQLPEGISDGLYWSVYTLDRRWSFGTGLPFAVQDADIHHRPAFPDDSMSSAYSRCMVDYSGIASEVRKSILQSAPTSPAICASTRDFLDFRVSQWQKSLPEKLQFRGIKDKFVPAKERRGEYRLRLILYLRANQMRTIIHRKSAIFTDPNSFNSSSVSLLASTAQDTIRILAALARETDIYHAQHKTFNHFLETALTSLLLILPYAGPERGASCLQEAFAAMETIRNLSTHSPITRALEEKLQNIQGLVAGLRPNSPKISKASDASDRIAELPPEAIVEANLYASQSSHDSPANVSQEPPVTRNAHTSPSTRRLAQTIAGKGYDPALGINTPVNFDPAAQKGEFQSDSGFPSIGTPSLPFNIDQTPQSLLSQAFSISESSPQLTADTSVPSDFDPSPDFYTFGDSFLRFPQLSELFKDYENMDFTFQI